MDNTEKRNDEIRVRAVKATEVAEDDKTDNIPADNEDTSTSVSLEKEPAAAVSLIKENDAPVSLVKDDTAEAADKTDADDEEEEIVFAGGEPPAAPPVINTAKSEPGVDEESDDSSAESVIVFAEKGAAPKKTKIARAKKRSPLVPILSVFAVLCAGAAIGTVIWAMNKDNTAESGTVSPQSTTGANSGQISTAEKVSDSAADNSQVSEEPLEISGVDTTNIFFGENVTVEGVNLAGKSLAQAHAAMQDRLLELRDPISITMVCDGKTLTLTQNDFNFDSDLSNVLLQAYHYSRGELKEPTIDNTYNNGVTDFKVNTNINTESVDAAIEKAAAFYDVQPVDAHVTKFDPNASQKFEYADGSDGFLLDHDELSTKIKGILNQGEKTGSFSIETHQTPFKISLEEIKAKTKLIASHRTTAANVAASNSNMKLAIRAMNGTVLQPGETFSFNEITGDTTNGNMHYYPNGTEGAYVPSTAYSHGKIVQDYGGGICQASTTTYLCALKANMEVVERHAHLYASSYAAYGLDATVDYGNLDMRFKNNFDLPVYICTYVYDYTGDGNEEIMVEMYGPISEEYDEIVPVGWVTYADSNGFAAKGAKVYFKDGKEVDRVNLPAGSYDYHYESYYSVINYMPNDTSFGPDTYATYETPTVYCPGGCGESSPIAYGTASQVLSKARNTAAAEASKPAEQSSKPSGTVITTR